MWNIDESVINNQKYPTNSINNCSLVPFIDWFIRKALLSEIQIMIRLRNLSLKKHWDSSNKVLLLYLSTSFYKTVTGKFTVSMHKMTYNTYGLNFSWYGTLFSKKVKTCNFPMFAISRMATFLACHGFKIIAYSCFLQLGHIKTASVNFQHCSDLENKIVLRLKKERFIKVDQN